MPLEDKQAGKKQHLSQICVALETVGTVHATSYVFTASWMGLRWHTIIVTQRLSHTTLSHAQLCQAHISFTQNSVTRNFVTQNSFTHAHAHAPLSQQLYDTQTLSYNLSSTISFLVPFPSHFYTCFVLCVRWKKLTCWVAVSGPIISSATATPISGLNFSCVRRGACSQSSSLPIAGFLPVHEVAYTQKQIRRGQSSHPAPLALGWLWLAEISQQLCHS